MKNSNYLVNRLLLQILKATLSISSEKQENIDRSVIYQCKSTSTILKIELHVKSNY